MCTLDGCLDFSDVIPNPKLMDTSLKMARQSNTVNFDNEMCSCEQFPASLLLEQDKNIIWLYLVSYLKSSWSVLGCAISLVWPIHTYCGDTAGAQAEASDRYVEFAVLKKQQSGIVFSSLCTAACDVLYFSKSASCLRYLQLSTLTQILPQQTIRTLCIKTRLWNEDSEFRERQTEGENETGRESSPGICIVLLKTA